jgi:hypothetical protein
MRAASLVRSERRLTRAASLVRSERRLTRAASRVRSERRLPRAARRRRLAGWAPAAPAGRRPRTGGRRLLPAWFTRDRASAGRSYEAPGCYRPVARAPGERAGRRPRTDGGYPAKTAAADRLPVVTSRAPAPQDRSPRSSLPALARHLVALVSTRHARHRRRAHSRPCGDLSRPAARTTGLHAFRRLPLPWNPAAREAIGSLPDIGCPCETGPIPGLKV